MRTEYGRIDYMPRAKCYRAVWYERRDIEIGRYVTYDEAAEALRSAVASRDRSKDRALAKYRPS